MNSLRVPLVRDAVVESVGGGAGTLTQPLVGLKVVDVGCGGGILSEVSIYKQRCHFAYFCRISYFLGISF